MTPSPSPSDPGSAPEPPPVAPATPPVDLVAPESPSGPPPAAVPPPVTAVRRRDHRLVGTILIAGVTFVLGLGVGYAAGRSASGSEPGSAETPDAEAEETPLEEAKAACASGSSDVTIGDGGDTLIIERAGAEESPGATVTQLACLMAELDVPDSVIDRIENTRALDGYQDAAFGAFSASWTYHPDDGLNMTVTYSD